MKKITLIAAIAMIAFTTNSFAQDQETAGTTTTAKVIKPIAITVAGGLNFGDLIGTAGGGTVTVSPTAARTSSDPGLINASTPGTIAVPTFTVTGEANYTYTIETPAAPIQVENGDVTPATMSVGTFVAAPSGTGTLDVNGSQTVTVGATITLGANQAVGSYTNSVVESLALTVYYN